MTKVADLSVDISVNGAQVAMSALKGVESAGSSAGKAMHELWTESGLVKLGFGALVVGAGELADSYAQVYNRVRLFSGSAAEAVAMQQKLVQVAIQARVPLEEIGLLYTKITASSKELGVSQDDILKVTKAIGQTFVLSGSSTQQAAMSANEFARAISEGTLNSRELKVLFGDNVSLAQALAKGLGLSVGQLREMVSAGQLTGEKMFGAILKQSDEIAQRAESVPPTISSGFQVLKVGMEAFLGGLDQAHGIVAGIGTMFRDIGKTLADLGAYQPPDWLLLIGAAINRSVRAGNQLADEQMFGRDPTAFGRTMGAKDASEYMSRSQLAARAAAGANPLFARGGGSFGQSGFGDNGMSSLGALGITYRGFGRDDEKQMAESDKALSDYFDELHKQQEKFAKAQEVIMKRFYDTQHELSTFQRLDGTNTIGGATGSLETLASTIDAARKARIQNAIGNVNGSTPGQADLSSSVGLVGANITDQFGGLADRMSSLGQQFGQILVSSISTGISTAVQSGSLAEGFRALTGALLGGLGKMLIDFGEKALLASKLMNGLMKAFAKLSPETQIIYSVGIIALGSAMVGLAQSAARSSFGGAGRSDGLGGGFNIPSTITTSGSYTGSSTAGVSMPSYNAPTGAVMSQGLSGVSTQILNVFSPDDPTTQRFVKETLLRAGRRGSF